MVPPQTGLEDPPAGGGAVSPNGDGPDLAGGADHHPSVDGRGDGRDSPLDPVDRVRPKAGLLNGVAERASAAADQ